MLKLMKYEFRKLRATTVVLLLVLAALELAFMAGNWLDKDELTITSAVLLSLLAFGAYVFILVSGVVSYSRELKDRTGYLVFMTPTRPIEVVLSKLICTLLAGATLTALLALTAWMDYTFLARKLGLDANMIRQINLYLRLLVSDGSINVQGIWLVILSTGLSVLGSIMLGMCTAYLAITVSATVLQNRKGFLRGMLSAGLFLLITWGAGWLTGRATDLAFRLSNRASYTVASMTVQDLTLSLYVSLGLNLVLGGVFAVASAYLLKRKVSL